MRDIVFLALDNMYYYNKINGEENKAYKYLDVKSAFTEVVNAEARRRREDKNG